MTRRMVGLLLAVMMLCVSAPAQSGQRERFEYTYAVVIFDCTEGRDVAVFSQVFGACYQETNHGTIARGQRDTFTQVARAACTGTATFESQRTGYPYGGSNAQDKANEELRQDKREMTYRRVESTYLQTPYSSRCQ